ncbi:MAG: hypothetical protein ACREDN_09620, partial [Aestuariivirga sp.]
MAKRGGSKAITANQPCLHRLVMAAPGLDPEVVTAIFFAWFVEEDARIKCGHDENGKKNGPCFHGP